MILTKYKTKSWKKLIPMMVNRVFDTSLQFMQVKSLVFPKWPLPVVLYRSQASQFAPIWPSRHMSLPFPPIQFSFLLIHSEKIMVSLCSLQYPGFIAISFPPLHVYSSGHCKHSNWFLFRLYLSI